LRGAKGVGVKSTKAQGALAAALILGALSSLLALKYASQGGAISSENVGRTLDQFWALYGPPVAVLAAFYFSSVPTAQNSPKRPIATATTVIALVLTALYAFSPAILLWYFDEIERAYDLLTKIARYGPLLSSGTLAFIFSHS
jgi:hypothetical protein